MRLWDLLENIYPEKLEAAYSHLDVSSICSDSRKAGKNSVFVALPGMTNDGVKFINDAIEKGACAVVVKKHNPSFHAKEGTCFLEVDDPAVFLRQLIKRFYGEDTQSVRAIGVTGTNGKTTLTYTIESILRESGKDCGVVGTVNYRMGSKVIPSVNTTPALVDNHKFLSDLAREGLEYCVMEVSSHALDQGRVDLIDFKVAAFTNLTSDHLDYHKTRENYFAVKSRLFKNLSTEATAVLNVDDAYGRKLASMTEAKVLTYGIEMSADIMAKDIQLSTSTTQFKVVTPEGEATIRTNLLGLFNIYNLLAAIGVCVAEGISLDKIRSGIEQLRNVPGRLEKVDCGQDFTILLDYAHTQDALLNVLQTIRKTSDSKIILVFGCGGDRDKSKRPEMGKVASQIADYTFITTDNPRSEEPQVIMEEIRAGFDGDHCTMVIDREEAITQALAMAKTGDIVLIAGKGHETYQIFKDRTIKFDERQLIRQHLLCSK